MVDNIDVRIEVKVEEVFSLSIFDSVIITNRISIQGSEDYSSYWKREGVLDPRYTIYLKNIQEAETVHKRYENILEFMMNLPLSDMPIYLNNEVELLKFIACKRLES